jgi:hypothetical protein
VDIKFYKAAGITIEVRSDFPVSENTFHPKFRKFSVGGPGEDNVRINHHFHLPEDLLTAQSAAREIYRNEQWQILRTDDSWIYAFTSVSPLDPGHSAVGIFNDDHTELSVYSTDFDRETYQQANFQALTLFNSDQVMFSRLLCDRNGMILHSNGFDFNDNGLLITGPSGAGKSTLSKMLKARGHKILCDDKMFITNSRAGFRIHGNWCHGSVPDTSRGSAPLKVILFLEQSSENSVEMIREKRDISHCLLNTIVKPFLPPDGWVKTFDNIQEMTHQVKCYRVRFDLSGNVCEMIENIVLTA